MSVDNAVYRLRVAQGFLAEAQQDLQLRRWRSAVDNAQLAVENAAKAALALVAPVGKTHHPAPLLREAIAAAHFPAVLVAKVERIAECAEQLGFDVHIQTDYGDEMEGRTPWELFDEADARQALELAEEALALAQDIIKEVRGEL
ncbi:MAG: HEPN domain-containing protein [Chloroflexi bacterium]|nr:MAG: HEPN domain-containing protein [Chloroflexota bacterium]